MDFPQALAGVFHPFAEVSNGAADGGALIGLPAELEHHAASRAIRRVCAGQLDPFALSLDALPLTVVPFDLRANLGLPCRCCHPRYRLLAMQASPALSQNCTDGL